MGIEFELKYRATPEILTAVAAEIVGENCRYKMATTYYDTPDRALSRRHCTLRRRMENETSVCTLKMTAPAGSRAEFEVERENILLAVPELCKLSEFHSLMSLAPNLTEICGARFDRLAITVHLRDCTLELALDEGVLLGAGKEIPLCELEVELKSGSREAAKAYARALALRYGLTPEPQSKFSRASALTGGI